jgi:hypothetical protein
MQGDPSAAAKRAAGGGACTCRSQTYVCPGAVAGTCACLHAHGGGRAGELALLELTATLTERTATLDQAYREREDAVLRSVRGQGRTGPWAGWGEGSLTARDRHRARQLKVRLVAAEEQLRQQQAELARLAGVRFASIYRARAQWSGSHGQSASLSQAQDEGSLAELARVRAERDTLKRQARDLQADVDALTAQLRSRPAVVPWADRDACMEASVC